MMVTIKCVVVLFIVANCMVKYVSPNKCTDVLKRQRIQEIVVKVPCVEKYTARCGWLSLKYCTFYRQTFCDRKMNDTITTYRIVTDCCKGFYKAENGTCVLKQPGVDYSYLKSTPSPNVTVTADPDYIEPIQKHPVEKKKTGEITGGGYAGIACGFVLLVCIVGFTTNAIRKKRRAREKDAKQNTTQQVVYMGQVDRSAEPVASIASCMPPPRTAGSKPSSPVSGKTTPCDLSMTAETKAAVTPLLSETVVPNSVETSEAETGATPLLSGQTTPPDTVQRSEADGGVVVPLLSNEQTDEDIPESDV